MLQEKRQRKNRKIQRQKRITMIDIYLCEDQAEQLRCLEKWITRYIEQNGPAARVVSARTRPEETLEDLCPGSTQLFFIDIQLGKAEMDGFALAEKVKRQNRDACIVYLTSKSEWAYRTFEYSFDVLDYIVKEPSEFLHEEPGDRLKERLRRIFNRISQKEQEKENGILIECGSRKVRVKKEDIISIEAIKGRHQLEIITEKEMLTSQMSLKAVEEMLDDSFIYVSRSCLISRKKIREMDRKNRFIVMTNGKKIEISYRKLKEVWSLL